MLKKITILCVAVLLLFGLTVAASGAQISYTQAYRTFLRSELKGQREAMGANAPNQSLRDAYMLDLNNDNTPELITIFRNDEALYGFESDIFTYTDSGIVRLETFSDIFNAAKSTEDSYYASILRDKDGKIYLYRKSTSQTSDGAYETMDIVEDINLWSDGKETLVCEARLSYERESEKDPFKSYKVNSQPSNQQEWEETQNHFATELAKYEVLLNGDELASGIGLVSGRDLEEFWNQDSITVTLNGIPILFDQLPVIENGRTLVPMRAILEAMGAKVEWNEAEQKITASVGSVEIEMKIGDSMLIVRQQTLMIKGSETGSPLR